GDEPEHPVEKIERAEDPEILFGGAARMPGGDPAPQARGEVERVVIEVELEQAEKIAVGILERRDIADDHHRDERGEIDPAPSAYRVHRLAPPSARRTPSALRPR